MLKEITNAVWYWLARWGCRVFCILFFRFRVYGKENVPKKGAFLLVSNHQSYLDPIFCGAFLSRHLHYLARKSLFANRLFAALISSVNAMPVKPGRADLSAMKAVIAKLKQGRGVCLFPEATRTSNGKITSLKGGVGLLARRAEAPIIPMLIDGAFDCWPRHKKMFSLFKGIVVCYGKAITAEQARRMKDKQLADLLTDTLRRMQNNCRQRQGKQAYDY